MELNRRDFTRLSMAALGGVMAGSTLGCGGGDPAPAPVGETPDDGGTPADGGTAVAEAHACRGLNTCKAKGKGGDNECAGQGACATVEHVCAGENACKYQGGCGENIANNECKTMGGCHVPITDADKWAAARASFEKRMQDAGKTVGAAPAAG